jgi:hypothetical protein
MVKTTKRSISEWSQLFKTFLEDPTPFEDGGALRRIGFATTVPLKTPSKKLDDMASTLPYGTPTGIRLIEEKAGFLDDATWDSVLDVAGIPDDLMSFLKATSSFLLDYENWWGQPLLDVNLAVNTAQTDLHTLKTSFENLSLNLGTALEIDGMFFPGAGTAISHATSSFATSPEFVCVSDKISKLEAVLPQFNQFWTDLQGIQTDLSQVNETLNKFDHWFNSIQPLFQTIKNLNQAITRLQQAGTFRSSPLNPGPSHFVPISPSSSVDSDSTIRFNTINERLKRLENRIVGDGVTIGHFVFQTLDDVRMWCNLHLKSNRFGLFLDGVLIYEFLAQDHADMTEVLTNLYSSQKNKFNNLYDSKVLASCQNLFLTIFGRASADGMDTAKTLPGLTSPDKWDNNGVTGLRFQLSREIINVDTQLTNAIVVAFRDSPEAAALAKELLYRSRNFVNKLENFISQDYAFWLAKEYAKAGSWELTCCSVRRLYEDNHQVRIIARDVRDLEDPASTTALVLWATLHTHVVMEEYTRRNFYEHPSISAVIAWHLDATHTKPDDSINSRMKKLEAGMTEHRRRLDNLESRLARVEQKNEITPPKGRGRNKNQPPPADP